MCKAELQGLAAEAKARGIDKTTIVAVSVDTANDLKQWQTELSPSILLLSDPDLAVIKRFELLHPGAGPDGQDAARPATLIISSSGEIVYSRPIASVMDRPDPRDIFDLFEKVK
ncbi:MAG: redoxin domain-containing protein [Planctomycetota bacterium]